MRGSFHAALEQLERYPIERNWRPAFLTPLSLLPPPRRMPLADLQGTRPRVAPFAQQPLTLAGAMRGLRDGSLSVASVVEQVLAVIARSTDASSFFATVAPREGLRRQMDDLEWELRAGVCRGSLHGIPLSVEEGFDVDGVLAFGSAPGLSIPAAPPEAGSVRLLRASGAILVGQAHAQRRMPGVAAAGEDGHGVQVFGYPGGAAAAVARGMTLGAVMADVQFPVVLPAALEGVVGCKPTFGLTPCDGMGALSWSLDQVGHLAASVEDAALLLDVLDPHPHVQYSRQLYKSLRGVRIGVPRAALEGEEEDVQAALRQAADALGRAGAALFEAETPAAEDFHWALGLGLVVREAEAAAHHGAAGAGVSATQYLQAQRAREDLRWRVLRTFDQFDALLMPTTRRGDGEADEGSAADEGREPQSLLLAQNSLLWSFLGFPAISLPCGWSAQGQGIGVMLAAAPFEDARLLSIAAALELEMQRG